MRYLEVLSEPQYAKLKAELESIPGWNEFSFIEKEVILQIATKAKKQGEKKMRDYDAIEEAIHNDMIIDKKEDKIKKLENEIIKLKKLNIELQKRNDNQRRIIEGKATRIF